MSNPPPGGPGQPGFDPPTVPIGFPPPREAPGAPVPGGTSIYPQPGAEQFPQATPPPGVPQPGPGGYQPPGGPPGAPVPGPYGGPPPSRKGASGCLIASIVGVIALFVVGGMVAAAVLVLGGDSDDDAGKEVFLEPTSSARDPFTRPVGEDQSVPNATTAGSAAGAGLVSMRGGEPGLYGGTQKKGSCNKKQLVDFLKDNDDKGKAWAKALDIDAGQIESYINGLTPVLLRSDTRVTNHGFKNGKANAIQSVLQSGTAVLVDNRGKPVTKCYCGNPLAEPKESSRKYTGKQWEGFSPTRITVVVQNTTVIENFTLIDINTGQQFTRPAGTSGDDDGAPTATTTTTTTSSTTTSTTEGGTDSTGPPSTEEPSSDAIEGSYTFQGTVADGSNGNCTAYDGTFEVTVSGSGSDRTVRVDAGGGDAFEGPIDEDDSFDLSAPLANGQGSQSLTGSFEVSGSTVTITGESIIESGSIRCVINFTAQKVS